MPRSDEGDATTRRKWERGGDEPLGDFLARVAEQEGAEPAAADDPDFADTHATLAQPPPDDPKA